MDTREGRETRVTSRIFWLITIVIIIVTNNKTTTSMRRKGLKVIRGFCQYFNHYCHHYHNQQLQGPLLAGTASAVISVHERTRHAMETREGRETGLPPLPPPPSSVTFFLSPTMQAAPSPPLLLSSSSISQWKKITSLHSNEIKTTPMYLQPNAPNIMRRMG